MQRRQCSFRRGHRTIPKSTISVQTLEFVFFQSLTRISSAHRQAGNCADLSVDPLVELDVRETFHAR